MTSRSDYTRNLAARFVPAPAPDDSARRESVASGREAMLWYDGDTKTSLDDKVKRACQAFSEKYGATAQTIYVNPAMLLDGAPIEIDGVKVIPDRMVQPQSFNVSAKEPK